jgi:hypothetical protein
MWIYHRAVICIISANTFIQGVFRISSSNRRWFLFSNIFPEYPVGLEWSDDHPPLHSLSCSQWSLTLATVVEGMKAVSFWSSCALIWIEIVGSLWYNDRVVMIETWKYEFILSPVIWCLAYLTQSWWVQLTAFTSKDLDAWVRWQYWLKVGELWSTLHECVSQRDYYKDFVNFTSTVTATVAPRPGRMRLSI